MARFLRIGVIVCVAIGLTILSLDQVRTSQLCVPERSTNCAALDEAGWPLAVYHTQYAESPIGGWSPFDPLSFVADTVCYLVLLIGLWCGVQWMYHRSRRLQQRLVV